MRRNALAEKTARRRVEGAREQEILAATLELLAETGYDRLTLDAVAARTRSSKATLYRRWASKSALVSEAVRALEPVDITLPDTGSVRGDLLALAGAGGYFDPAQVKLVGGLSTAMSCDPEVHEAVRQTLHDVGTAHLRALLVWAAARGVVRDDLDIELICSVVPAMALYRIVFRTPGELPADLVRSVLEQIVLPAIDPHHRHDSSAEPDLKD